MATRTCVLYHSASDLEFSLKLMADLHEHGMNVNVVDDEESTVAFDEIVPSVEREDIRLLVVISEQALMSERWLQETKAALWRRADGVGLELIPVSLIAPGTVSETAKVDLHMLVRHGLELRQHFTPDFHQWRDSQFYASALSRLLRRLNGLVPPARFDMTFAPGLSKQQVQGVLESLAKYYRACGGVGFETDVELADVLIEEPADVLA